MYVCLFAGHKSAGEGQNSSVLGTLCWLEQEVLTEVAVHGHSSYTHHMNQHGHSSYTHHMNQHGHSSYTHHMNQHGHSSYTHHMNLHVHMYIPSASLINIYDGLSVVVC